MGWWTQNQQGHSFAQNEEGPEMVWGDGPADTLDSALRQITNEFQQAQGRNPTPEELHAGLEFSLGGPEEERPRGNGAPRNSRSLIVAVKYLDGDWGRLEVLEIRVPSMVTLTSDTAGTVTISSGTAAAVLPNE
jgi:hypothetical protein